MGWVSNVRLGKLAPKRGMHAIADNCEMGRGCSGLAILAAVLHSCYHLPILPLLTLPCTVPASHPKFILAMQLLDAASGRIATEICKDIPICPSVFPPLIPLPFYFMLPLWISAGCYKVLAAIFSANSALQDGDFCLAMLGRTGHIQCRRQCKPSHITCECSPADNTHCM